MSILLKNNIYFEREKTFQDLKNGLYRFDFYLPHMNNKPTLLEVDGEYHFKPIRGRLQLKHQQENDRRKNSYCLAHNINLYRIPYWEIYNINTIEDMIQPKYLVSSKWHNDKLNIPK